MYPLTGYYPAFVIRKSVCTIRLTGIWYINVAIAIQWEMCVSDRQLKINNNDDDDVVSENINNCYVYVLFSI